jgi:hypothetical protein
LLGDEAEKGNGICQGVANWIRRSFAMRVSNIPVAWGTNR